jgi:hypothetical protein
MKRWRYRASALFALAVPLMTRVARGQESGAEGPLAEALYREGRKLLAEGKISEACPKFAESYRLDPATGTLLNLASCHENEHRLATAWFEFSGAVTLARRDRRYDRVRFAQERLAIIEPRLSYLTVVVGPGVGLAGLEVRVDGVVVGSAARGVSTPVDPGDHTIEASAPARKGWSQRVAVTEDAMNIAVSIPVLEPDPAAPTAPPSSESSAPPASRGAVPTSVYLAGGVTLALVAAAGVTGYVYMQHRDEDGSEQQEPELGRNLRLGAVNLGLTVGALVGAGVTAYLYWTRPLQAGPPSVPRAGRGAGTVMGTGLAPWLGPDGGGLCLRGSL